MRNFRRIPIILDILETNPNPFQDVIKEHRKTIQEFWENNPDLRFTQVCIQFGYPNLPGGWFYKEDEELVIGAGLAQPEDVYFWGSNYDKDGNYYDTTTYKLLKDMDDDHIIAVWNLVKDRNIHPNYKEYFKKRSIYISEMKHG